MDLTISLLGPPRVERDGAPVVFDTRKATALLAHLALAERARSREALAELLWPGRDLEHARGALRRTLSTLRKTIGEEWVDASGGSVALARGSSLHVDVERFRALAAGGSESELAEAVELSRGGFMEGFALRDSPEFDHWLVAEADALRRELAVVLGRLVDQLAGRRELTRAIALARRRLELDPLHEPAHRQLVRLYAWSGDRATALAQYRDCVRILSQELGVAPLAETTDLYEQINEGIVGTDAAQAAVAQTVAESTSERGGSGRSGARARAAGAELPLVGRGRELETLLDLHERIADDGHVAVIEGEAGIGKTRLAGELLERARERGAAVLAARCHDDEAGIAYGPVVDLLRAATEAAAPAGSSWLDTLTAGRLGQAARLMPRLSELRADVTAEPAPAGPGDQARLLDGVSDVLTAASRGSSPGVIFLDDVHAADEASLDLIAYLARRLRDRPLLLLLSWRAEEVPPGHRLRRLAAELAGFEAASIISLARLDEAQTAELVHAAGPPAASAELPGRAFRESEGLPLFVVEYLAALRSGEEVDERMLSGGAGNLLRARLDPLGETARQVLGAAAVVGRSFDSQTVRVASGRSEEETVDAIEELSGYGVLHESRHGEYEFSHARMRTFVYEQASLARRRLLHGRVADALRPARPSADVGLIAHHYRLAGRDGEAAEHHRLAAEHAGSLHAHADALEHLEAALALGHPDVAWLHERTGDHLTLVGDYAGALASYEAAAARSERGSLASIEQKIAGVLQRRGEWQRAEARLQGALEAGVADQPALRARIQADRSLNAHRRGLDERAVELAREARTLAERAGDARALAQAHNLLGVLARSAGDLAGARTELERSLALAEGLGETDARVAALNNLALVSGQAGELDRARELTLEALELCIAHGDRHREAALDNNLADLLHAAGRREESMAHLKRAVALFSAIDADETTRQPEVWKLVSW